MPTATVKRLALACAVAFAAHTVPAAAQDIRGLEVCTAEKQMERRTGCLQANTDFLQQELVKLKRDSDAKLAAAGREIASAKAELVALKAELVKLTAEVVHLRAKAEPPGNKK